MRWVDQSRRRTCSSSCTSARRIASSLHSRASTGRMIAGRVKPHVNGAATSSCTRISTGFRMRACTASRSTSARPSNQGNARRRITRSRQIATAKDTEKSSAPAAQTAAAIVPAEIVVGLSTPGLIGAAGAVDSVRTAAAWGSGGGATARATGTSIATAGSSVAASGSARMAAKVDARMTWRTDARVQAGPSCRDQAREDRERGLDYQQERRRRADGHRQSA